MTYTSNKVDGQNLMFAITTTHNGAEITFNVVCANDEAEVPDLVAHYLDFLDAPPVVTPQPTAESAVDQQAIITALEARIAALEAK
jgi:hypothetical protein